MYNMDKEIRAFYREQVVLPISVQKELIEKKKINLKRLTSGIEEYNKINNTNYKIVDTIVQGSVAMQTIVQSELNDYDIDVGIAFNKHELPEPTTSENNTKTVKDIVYNSLLKKSEVFKFTPEKKTNCIRILYADGYHIDFAIYRRFKDKNEYVYEHCGADWEFRNPRNITTWFKNRDKAYDYNLKRVVRLLKAYLKQSNWSVPGGLIQSVLVDECFYKTDRLDEMLYCTILNIINRIEKDPEIYNPIDVDTENKKISLLKTNEHKRKVIQMKGYLIRGLKKLQVLFKDNCTKEEAIDAWGNFFNNKYWNKFKEELEKSALTESFYGISKIGVVCDYNETEEFIEDIFPVSIKHSLKIDCNIEQSGYRIGSLKSFLRGKYIKANCKLQFKILETSVSKPYIIYWKILNVGDEAIKRNKVRGQIFKGEEQHVENSQFNGNHQVSCYIVKDGECVAKDTIEVPILI